MSKRVIKEDQYIGEKDVYELDFSRAASNLGTTVSSVTWTNKDGLVTIDNESLASNVSQARIHAISTGCAVIVCEAIMADGQERIKVIHITITDPTASC